MVLAAIAIDYFLAPSPARDGKRSQRIRHLLLAAHWTLLGLGMICLPLCAAAILRRENGQPWLHWPAALLATAAALALLGLCIAIPRRGPVALALITLLVIVTFDTTHRYGLRASGNSASSMKPLADLIWTRSPDARMFTSGQERLEPPADLAIYLNRAVVATTDPAHDIHPAPLPQVLVIFQGQREAPPGAPPPPADLPPYAPSWQKIGVVPRGRNFYHAFLLPPTAAPSITSPAPAIPAANQVTPDVR
jgi:hypothetical protein